MSDTENQNTTEEETPAAIPDDIIAEMKAAEERIIGLGPDQFAVPATPINDFLQIASGGGAIVESQAEWAAEGGILNNGFPTGIVLQEQYNKAWRQSTSWIRILGWHASQLIQQNVVDDGNSEKLWRQLYEAFLVQNVVFDAVGTNSYTTPNTFGLTWTTPPRAGTEITLWVTNPNTSTTCTLNFAGTGVFPIKHLDGKNPRIGDMAAHVRLSFSSGIWCIDYVTINMLNLRIGDLIYVNSATTVYISPTGNDTTGDGTSGSPWQTLQFAYDKIAAQYFNLSAYPVTIQMANGIYTSGLAANSAPLGSSQVIIRGNPSTPSAVRVVVTGQSCFYARNNGNLVLDGLSVNCSFLPGPVGGSGIATQYSGHIYVTNVIFEHCDWAHMFAAQGGSIECSGNVSITGGSQAFYYITSTATITAAGQGQNVTVTISGSPTFTIAFAIADGAGSYLYAPNGNLTFSGAAVGPRYQSNYLAMIDSQGGGTNFFPGSIAGSVTNSALYR